MSLIFDLRHVYTVPFPFCQIVKIHIYLMVIIIRIWVVMYDVITN